MAHALVGQKSLRLEATAGQVALDHGKPTDALDSRGLRTGHVKHDQLLPQKRERA